MHEMTIIEMFSTHAKINDSNGHLISWVADRELRINFIGLLESYPNANEEFWALYFLNNFHSDPLAPKHISAYLEHLCSQAARRVHRKLSKGQYTQLGYDDVLQIGLLIAYEPQKFFRNFNQGRPLKNYVCTTLERKIDEIIRQQMGQRRLSDWGLLKYRSRTYLQEALQHQGYRQPRLGYYLSAYDCFMAVYAPQKLTAVRSLPPPTDRQLQEMANLYNLQATLGTADLTQMEQWLWDCIKALRNYQTLLVVSFDAPCGGDDSASWSEITPNPASDSDLEQLMIQEHTPQLMAILSQFLEQIDQKTDNYLLLSYGVDLDYRSIAPIFNLHYTTISRRSNQVKQNLLTQVAQWAKEKLNITPDSEMVAQMNAPLQECLIHYYQDLIFHAVFQQSWQRLDLQRRHVLHLSCFRLKDVSAIAHELQLAESHVSEGLETGTQELADAISNWIQNRLTVSSDSLNPLADEIADLVQTLVANYPDSELK